MSIASNARFSNSMNRITASQARTRTAAASSMSQRNAAALLNKKVTAYFQKEMAAQVPKSGLYLFGYHVAKLLGQDWNAVAGEVGDAVLSEFKAPLLRNVEMRIKSAKYTRVIRGLAQLFIEKDAVALAKNQVKYGFTFAELAVLNTIVTRLESLG